MKVALIDVDSHNFPNLVLMKLSAWHKACGDEVALMSAATALQEEKPSDTLPKGFYLLFVSRYSLALWLSQSPPLPMSYYRLLHNIAHDYCMHLHNSHSVVLMC